MTRDKEEQERDELELEPETIKDLDVSDVDANELRGGCSWTHQSLLPN